VTQFHKGARVASAEADEDPGVDVSGLIDQALLWPQNKTRGSDADYIGRGCFAGLPFKVTAVRRTSRTGRQLLKLFLTPLQAPPPRTLPGP
jgi:hypothetical protein